MDKEKILRDRYVIAKTELDAEKKLLINKCKELEDKIIQEGVRHKVFSKVSVSKNMAKEAYDKLQALQEEKKECEEKLRQCSDQIEKLFLITDTEPL